MNYLAIFMTIFIFIGMFFIGWYMMGPPLWKWHLGCGGKYHEIERLGWMSVFVCNKCGDKVKN